MTTSFKKGNIDDVKTRILITYASAIAEEILLGEFHTGCMGSDDADFETASRLIKWYIVMSNDSVSKTLLDEELAPQMIELSKQFYQETKELLTDNVVLLQKVADELMEKDFLSRDDVDKFVKEQKWFRKNTKNMGNSNNY